MQTAEFHVNGLVTGVSPEDLRNAITGISGVGHVGADEAAHTLTVTYDPAYVIAEMLRKSIEGAGYPVEHVTERHEDH